MDEFIFILELIASFSNSHISLNRFTSVSLIVLYASIGPPPFPYIVFHNRRFLRLHFRNLYYSTHFVRKRSTFYILRNLSYRWFSSCLSSIDPYFFKKTLSMFFNSSHTPAIVCDVYDFGSFSGRICKYTLERQQACVRSGGSDETDGGWSEMLRDSGTGDQRTEVVYVTDNGWGLYLIFQKTSNFYHSCCNFSPPSL